MVLEPNAPRFDPAARKGHVESWFLKANDAAGERAIWIKATIYAADTEPERPLAEGWFVAFDRRSGATKIVALKLSRPFAEASFRRDGFGVSIGRADERLAWTAGRLDGAFRDRSHAAAFSLAYEGDGAPVAPFPFAAMYAGRFPKQKLLTPMPDARVTGEVTLDGERWELGGWRGMQGHNWGRGHSDRYAWAHVNQWDTPEPVVLEGFSGQVKLGPWTTPLTTIVCVRHRGVAYDFNAPRDLLRATGDVTLRRWDFACEGRHGIVEGSIEASSDEMAGLYYPTPDGAMTYCLNSKLARARVHFQPRGRAPMTLTSRAAALEIGTRDAGHGVRMLA